MANLDKIDQEITDILLEHLVLANDNGQPYIKSTDTAVEAIKALIATQVREATNKVFVKFNKATLAGENQAYRKGYNDNARDCYCNSPGATEGVLPHKHLLDDGESHNIRPNLPKGDDK